MVLDRRGFMMFLAGASAGVMATPIPWKLLDDVSIWTQNWPWIPSNVKGATTYTYAVSKMCPSCVPMKIRLVGGRPVRVLPVEDHPLGGGVTALAVAEIQMMHSPGRVRMPLKRGPDGGFIEISWKEAVDLLLGKLEKAGNNVAAISGDENGSTNEVLSAFARAFGSEDVFVMPSEGQSAARAASLMGIDAQFGYDLENSDYVLSIGANLLESWGPVVRNRRIFKNSRPHSFANKTNDIRAEQSGATFVYAGSTQNATAAVANSWLPVLPGTEGILALGIANMLMAKGRMANASDFAAFRNMASRFSPEEVSRLTGVDGAKLESVVDALLAAKAPVVIVGSEFNQGAGAAPLIAGFAINALLGSVNRRGGMRMLPLPKPVLRGASSRQELYGRDLPSWLAGGPRPDFLLLHEANPVYALPDPARTAEALKAVPFKVSFTTFMDETAALSDLVLPIPMGIERADDVESPYGVGKSIYCVTTPSAVAQAEVIGTANTVLHLCRELGKDLGYKLYQDLMNDKAKSYGSNFGAMVNATAAESDASVAVSAFRLRPDILAAAFEEGRQGGKLALAVCSKLSMGTAKTGIPPYNTKTIRASELEGGVMSVMMNRKTASGLGLKSGDSVIVESDKKKIGAKLYVHEGVMSDTVAVPLGFGHTALDEFSRNKGANVMELLKAAPEPETGLTVWTKTGVNVSKA